MVLERGEGMPSPEPSSPEEMITTGSSQAAHSSHAWAPITHTRAKEKKTHFDAVDGSRTMPVSSLGVLLLDGKI